MEEYARAQLSVERGADADILIHADDAALAVGGGVEALDKRLADHHLAEVAVGRLGEVAALDDLDAHKLQVAVTDTIQVSDVEILRIVTRQVDVVATGPLDG